MAALIARAYKLFLGVVELLKMGGPNWKTASLGCVLIVLTTLRQSLAQPSSCYIHEENDIKDLSSFFQKTDLFLRDFIHRFDSDDTIHQTGSPSLFNYTRKALGLSYSIADEIEFAPSVILSPSLQRRKEMPQRMLMLVAEFQPSKDFL